MRPVKYIIIVSALFALVCLLTSCAASQQKIIWGIDSNSVPLTFHDEDGSLSGFDIDLAREIGKRTGMEVSFVSVDLSSMLKKFDAGKADAVIGDFPAGGSKNVLYTRPYLKCGQVIVVNSGSTIQNKNGLVGKAVGVLAGSAAAKALSRDDIVLKIKDRAPVNYYDYISAFMDLDASKLDAIALDETAGRYYVSQKETQYRLLGDRFPDSEEYAVAVRRNDGRLRNQIQDALNQMTKDGTTAQISKKWFGEDLTIH